LEYREKERSWRERLWWLVEMGVGQVGGHNMSYCGVVVGVLKKKKKERNGMKRGEREKGYMDKCIYTYTCEGSGGFKV